MSFLAPGAFFLGLLLPVIVALYLLKLRRVEREVPSTYLWRKMVRDVEANAPWQKLRPNLLMILQLLFLAALILALTRPFTWVEGAGGQATILILDSSASMAAVDVAPSRIESAKQRAAQLVDDLPGPARVTVIEAGREAQVLLSSSLDRRAAHLAIQQVRAGTGGSDMNTALELASAIASRQPGTEIIVLSDGNVTLPQRMTVKGALRYIPFGLSDDNQAISLLNLSVSPGSGSLTAFAQVSNYSSQRATRDLSIYADGQLVYATKVEDIPAMGAKNVIAEGIDAGTRVVEARLGGQDALALDDRAAAVVPETRPIPVTLVSQGNLFIQTALSLMPGVTLTQQEPPAASPSPAPTGQPTAAATPSATPAPTPTANPAPSGPAALTIYDNEVPETLPDSGSLLFIAPPASTALFTTTGLVQQPAPRIIDPSDPLAANLNLNEVSILNAARIPLPDWATPVVSGDLPGGDNIPLIFRGEVNGQRVAVIAFDLRSSDLPLQVAFPLLWSNLIDWLAPGARSPLPVVVTPGESLAFNAPDGATTAAITRPDGSTVQAHAEAGRFVFTDTAQLGVYQVQFSGGSKTAGASSARPSAFAANLFSPQESNLKPAANLPVQTNAAGTGTAVPQRSQREWWRWLALLALGLLAGEWLVYQRAGLARLRDWAAARTRGKVVRIKTGNP